MFATIREVTVPHVRQIKWQDNIEKKVNEMVHGGELESRMDVRTAQCEVRPNK